jgi:predicted nucleic acid-binding protein
MSLLVDTSALYAILDADDSNHISAKETWISLLNKNEDLISTNYILVETFALVQRRLGIDAVKTFYQDVVPVLQIEWVSPAQHLAAINQLLATGHRQISLVDWVSFIIMRGLGIQTAFAYDSDFEAQGFECIPRQDVT